MRLARLIMRVVLGALYIGHGTQKLLGWFGGYGPEGTGQFFESIGLRPGKRNALAAGVSEAGGGALILLGLLTPVGAAMISGSMITAIRTAHAGKGPWASEGGWEYPLVAVVACMALAEAGPGRLSLDHALGIEMSGTLCAVAAVAAAAGGSILVTSMAGESEEAEQPAAQEAVGLAES
jgi:putative oxidoreductase